MSVIDPKYYRLVLSLAGTIQAIELVNNLAHTGELDDKLARMHLQSLLITEPKNIIDVYQDETFLQQGLESLKNIFHKKNKQSLRYLMAIIMLQDKLRADRNRCHTLQQGLKKIEKRLQFFDILHNSIIDNFADLYLDNIASFRYRIQILGQQNHLTQQPILAKIRALLLTAIRSAMLWRQVGGNRWQFFFKRQLLDQTAQQLLDAINNHEHTTYH